MDVEPAREGLFMRNQIKATLVSMSIGIAICGVLAYSLMLYSVTRSIVSKGQAVVVATR
jgi:hypothetical protein